MAEETDEKNEVDSRYFEAIGVGGRNLSSLLNEIKEEKQRDIKVSKVFTLPEILVRTNNSENIVEPIVNSFFYLLTSRVSYKRAYDYLKNMNGFFEENQKELKNDINTFLGKHLRSKIPDNIYFLFRGCFEDYLESMSKEDNNRELDFGDLIRVVKTNDLYSDSIRNLAFPIGSFGEITAIPAYDKVIVTFFNKEFEDSAFKEYKKCVSKELTKNSAVYEKKELKFVPINSLDKSQFERDINKFIRLFSVLSDK
ncbi:MAG: hypothetical protein Q7S33_00325 [Nanoarchaeota archaeon]|nr:hypothetical protein [Nanoarchaeota archaeon]